MIVFLNGRFVSEEEAVVSVFDRSFLYGDGLFEAIRVYNAKPFRWTQHLDRLRQGAEFLGIRLAYSIEELRTQTEELVQRNQMPDCLLRMTLSRGVGIRGYSPKGADRPTLVMSLHPTPAIDPDHPLQWNLATASLRVPANDPLATHKTCNKLHQVMARAEAESQGANEALLLNTDDEVAEGASSNLCWVENGTVCTTPLASGILAGVTRSLVLELCQTLSLPTQEKGAKPNVLQTADAVFLTLTTVEIVEVIELDGHRLRRSPLVQQIHKAYRRAVQRETK